MVDLILLEIVERGMKNIMINHAKSRCKDEKILNDLDKLSSREVYSVVNLLFGEPECFKKG